MENKFKFSQKDLAVLKAANDFHQMNNVEYSKVVLKKIRTLLQLINSLHGQKVEIQPWLVWSEPLIQKLSFHSVNIVRLFEGTELPLQDDKGVFFKVLDKPSIIALLRVATENFLTFDYIYFNADSDEEKKFRLSVWRYCGIKQRVEFDLANEAAKKKQIEEMRLLGELKNEIIHSTCYQKFNPKQQKVILDGRKARLFNSWIDLIKMSGLRVRLFKNMYGYKSNYSHSEFISVLQVHSGNYVFNPKADLAI